MASILRDLPLSMRKTTLEGLLRSRQDRIFINPNPFATGAIGPDRFWAAFRIGL